MVFAETSETHEPVAVAAAERVASGWVELGWVAVAPPRAGPRLGGLFVAHCALDPR